MFLKNHVACAAFCSVIVSLCSLPLLAQESKSSLLPLLRDKTLKEALYQHPERLVSKVAPSGAVGENSNWEQGTASRWFIELQRYGADWIQAGIVTDNEQLVQQGWKLLKWGFDRQDTSGGFAGTGDPFHSTAFFVEASARALLLLKEKPALGGSIDQAAYSKKVHEAALWLIRPENEEPGLKHNRPYTHRYWLLAAALGETAELVNDSHLRHKAESYASEGLRRQDEQGINPEKSGWDVNYQALGILLACKYCNVCRNETTNQKIKKMVESGLLYELTHIDETGTISMSGSTRTGNEVGRGGETKKIDYKIIVQSLVAGAEVTGDLHFREVASQIASSRKWMRGKNKS